MKALVSYFLYRFGLFVACLVLLWVCGIRGWLVIVWAALLALLLSYLLLGRPRARANEAMAARAARRAARPHGPRSPSDEDVEDALTDGSSSGRETGAGSEDPAQPSQNPTRNNAL